MTIPFLIKYYRAQFKVTIAGQLQYRGALVIWLLDLVLEPVISLVVWSNVARSQGGEVDGFTVGAFAAYFLATMVVNHATFNWIMWEFGHRVRTGSLSPQLLRPIHPIHAYIAENLTYKALTLVVVLPLTALLTLAFRPTLATEAWAVAAFVPALGLAFALRFAIEWTLALAAFWVTRLDAINQLYYVALIFLSGQVAPLALYPEPIRVVAALLPFRWFVAFPVELLLGRLSPRDAFVGFGAQAVWLVGAVLLLRLAWRRGVRQYSAVGA